MADNVTTTIDSVEALQARIKEMRAAQAEFAKFTQEQVDKIFYAAAMAANKARIPLAKMAVEETGYGIMEDKVIKNHYASEYIYNKYKDMKDLRRHLRRQGLRLQADRRAHRPGGRRHPDGPTPPPPPSSRRSSA